MPLLVNGTFTPGSVTTIASLCDDWFQDEASLVSFVFRSVFFDLRARDWDQQGVPTSEFDGFVAEILPRLNAVLTALPGDSTAALQDLVLAYRDFVSAAMCHVIPISLVPRDPDRSAVSWTEKPHLSPEVAMSRKRTGMLCVAKQSSPPSGAVAPSTRSPKSST